MGGEIRNGNVEKATISIPEIKFTKLFINGEFVHSISGKTFESIDPRTEEVIANVSEGDKEDVDLAVKVARQAFDHGPWPRLPGCERRRIMLKFADLIDENVEELAALDTLDAANLYSLGKAKQIHDGAELIRYYAGAADKIHGTTLKMSRELQGYTLVEPIGPAEQTPLSALYYAHLAKQAGVPDGVINVVTGYGSTAGAAISSHMDIDMESEGKKLLASHVEERPHDSLVVSFTGSTETGHRIMQGAATSNLKAVSLELGGKSPFIVFDDADVDRVALALGQICVAGTRIFVQEGIYDKFVARLLEEVKTWVVGDPFDPNVNQGPQVDKKQYEKVLLYIERGKKEGATLLVGGKPLPGKGYYIEPTIFTDVTDDMTIAKEEIFGPVMSIMKFKSVEEAIKRANGTKYGLAAGIMTNDLNIANTVARSVRAGAVWINCYFAFDNDLPVGGYKMSGFGKDMGIEALHKYLLTKSVATPIFNSPWL
ncbi:UNVERIFIED_CONTAM: Aldehyde dehydrogenase family 2 member C4 [Sesamum calycinum]|uniref:Aldehyde dehydrogenase family 2 member C4 n=1 Tax=Sesamum calycinum TaxID=2727403 RepID=A0AAW2QM60_9LAMI